MYKSQNTPDIPLSRFRSLFTLSISGLLLLYGGISRISNPLKTYLKNSGITIENEVNVLNEAQGTSLVMLFEGLIMLLGTFVPELTLTSLIIATLILLGFAFGRSLSIVLDGKTNKLLIQGWITEIVLGSANVFCPIYTLF